MFGSESTTRRAIAAGIACLSACAYSPNSTIARENSGSELRKILYWDELRAGANYFNEVPTRKWFVAASRANIGFVRLAYGKWAGGQRDFLLGSADGYRGLVEEDFAKLQRYLDLADSLGMKIVLAPLSLPGARWRQLNGGERDGRLWTDPKYLPQAARFWKDLAARLRDHGAVVGYDLINEPHPEWFHGKRTFWDQDFKRWYVGVRGAAGDLNRFNRTVAASIREVDPHTPIIVESGLYATPWAFEYLETLEENHILYSFHMYEPYEYTTRRINRGRFSYPGEIAVEGLGPRRRFDAQAISDFFEPVRSWARRNGVPPSRIFVGEFGCDRRAAGAAEYLADLIGVFSRECWHWAFYAFREDSWPQMDYELGMDRPGEAYWAAVEANNLSERYGELYAPRRGNPLWSLLKDELGKRHRPAGGARE